MFMGSKQKCGLLCPLELIKCGTVWFGCEDIVPTSHSLLLLSSLRAVCHASWLLDSHKAAINKRHAFCLSVNIRFIGRLKSQMVVEDFSPKRGGVPSVPDITNGRKRLSGRKGRLPPSPGRLTDKRPLASPWTPSDF